MSIDKVLSELIKKFNLNALELERLTGVPSSTVYRLLKEKSVNPTIEVLKKLASFFQISVSQLIGEESLHCKQIPLVMPENLHSFVTESNRMTHIEESISIDFPVGTKCFATLSQDNLMEPFIFEHSIIIVDPDKNIHNQDFVLLIKDNNDQSIIRQIIFDGLDYYLKVSNSNFPIDLKKVCLDDYLFYGVIVHYRTNLFKFGKFAQENRTLDIVSIVK